MTTSRLARRLGLFDAVIIGLGAMIGAGVFAAVGPAAGAAGGGLLLGLGIAAAVAYCNATSSAQLAARYPVSGGAYVYGRERLGHFWGYLAGWSFVAAKVASCAAIALTFASYAGSGAHTRLLAVAGVVVLSTVNYLGIQKTAWATRVAVFVVLATLATAAVAALGGGDVDAGRIGSLTDGGVHGILQAAGLLFFAFAGYARLATLGEEVRDPERTIPRAISIALWVTFAVYTLVAVAVLVTIGPERAAASPEPLTAAVRSGSLHSLAPIVSVGATVATLSVLISLLAGVGRTVFAMAANTDLPRWFAAVHPTHRVPHRAELAVSAVVIALVMTVDLRGAIGFSAFAVLAYYGIANAAAWTLPRRERHWRRVFSAVGLLGCLALSLSLPAESIVKGVALLVSGAAAWVALVWWRGSARRRRRASNPG